jgi:hypothetical protein
MACDLTRFAAASIALTLKLPNNCPDGVKATGCAENWDINMCSVDSRYNSNCIIGLDDDPPTSSPPRSSSGPTILLLLSTNAVDAVVAAIGDFSFTGCGVSWQHPLRFNIYL